MNRCKAHYIGLYEEDIQLIVNALRDNMACMAHGMLRTECQALKDLHKSLETLADHLEAYLTTELPKDYTLNGVTY